MLSPVSSVPRYPSFDVRLIYSSGPGVVCRVLPQDIVFPSDLVAVRGYKYAVVLPETGSGILHTLSSAHYLAYSRKSSGLQCDTVVVWLLAPAGLLLKLLVVPIILRGAARVGYARSLVAGRGFERPSDE